MNVAITGATGFIGAALVRALSARGDRVRALGRSPDRLNVPEGVDVARFDPNGPSDPSPFEGMDAVVHLAGETVAGRWTREKKRAIRESRVRGTRAVVDSIGACKNKPRVLVCASAVGYYGNRRDEPLLESSAPGDDFLAQVCVEWEREAQRAQTLGMRTVCLRQGIVFGPNGGALREMLPPFRAFAGGPYGNGSQWIPWIHLDDDVALCLFALDNPIHGPVNAVSPDITTSTRLARAIGAALHRPAFAYAPAIALYAILGEFASTLLASQLVLADAALRAGFAFEHELLETALVDVLAAGSDVHEPVHTFEDTVTVKAPLERVFAFFADASNLARITPPGLDFRMRTATPVEMQRGAVIEYTLKVRGVRMRWKSLITDWRPLESFVDYQVRGPYELWRHEHIFEERPGGVAVRDRVAYSLPFAPVGELALPLVRADVGKIFDFRRASVARVFAA
ncbi:MAG: TIGR01777 family oxidoreductase [Candidatus Eremiobacteraeota bacterium]|nr:TIGR01777 family oxidoreductase [Candidatus Eremiobacteraeota bacterium]